MCNLWLPWMVCFQFIHSLQILRKKKVWYEQRWAAQGMFIGPTYSHSGGWENLKALRFWEIHVFCQLYDNELERRLKILCFYLFRQISLISSLSMFADIALVRENCLIFTFNELCHNYVNETVLLKLQIGIKNCVKICRCKIIFIEQTEVKGFIWSAVPTFSSLIKKSYLNEGKPLK